MWIKDLAQYSSFCETHQAEIPIFYQPWWLDAVCSQGIWLPFISADGLAVCPIYVKSKWGFKYVTMPPLTYKLGVWSYMQAVQGNYSFVGVLDVLPTNFAYILQNIPYSEEEQLALDQAKIETAENFHFIHTSLKDEQEILRSMNRHAKRNVKKAEAYKLVLNKDENPLVMHDLLKRSLARNRYLDTFSRHWTVNLIQLCKEKRCGEVWSAVDETGKVHSALFFVKNQRFLYFIMSGIDERIKQVGGNRMLHWNALKMAASNNCCIDLCGGMSPNFASVFSSMGAEKHTYIHVEHYPNALVKYILRIGKKIRNIIY